MGRLRISGLTRLIPVRPFAKKSRWRASTWSDGLSAALLEVQVFRPGADRREPVPDS